MHNSYFLLNFLADELEGKIKGYNVVSCFSQAKDELVLEFNNGFHSFFIKAYCSSSFSCLSFPKEFARARKNSVDLFPEIILKKVDTIICASNERSFFINLTEDHSLIFKMHGNRANVLLVANNHIIKIFRNELKEDFAIKPDALNRELPWTFEFFNEHHSSLEKSFFTLSKVNWNYLKGKDWDGASPEKQWELLHNHYEQLLRGQFFIANKGREHQLLLFESGQTTKKFDLAIEALNEFSILKSRSETGFKKKLEALKLIEGREKQARSYIEKHRALLKSVLKDNHYQLWADTIMANLDVVQKGMEKISLPHPSHPEQEINIKLKKELNAIKNAEVFFRKAKNQKIEIEKITHAIQEKEKHISLINSLKLKIETPETDINKMLADAGLISQQKQSEIRLPYKEIEFNGFVIRIGKSAADNDELTLKHSHKEDLWLHAKDVAGSHVLIKHQSGKKFPKDVIERAAQLAAFNSKRKGESLSPVAYTEKKFVRKRKGDPPGMVVVEKEKVILVEPTE